MLTNEFIVALVSGYEVRYSEDFATLLNNFDTCNEVNYIDTGVAFPGESLTYEVSVTGGVNSVSFFAVRSIGINDAKVPITMNSKIYVMVY